MIFFKIPHGKVVVPKLKAPIMASMPKIVQYIKEIAYLSLNKGDVIGARRLSLVDTLHKLL
jgi:hypothetical protein